MDTETIFSKLCWVCLNENPWRMLNRKSCRWQELDFLRSVGHDKENKRARQCLQITSPAAPRTSTPRPDCKQMLFDASLTDLGASPLSESLSISQLDHSYSSQVIHDPVADVEKQMMNSVENSSLRSTSQCMEFLRVTNIVDIYFAELKTL